jgi:hypothetical protein
MEMRIDMIECTYPQRPSSSSPSIAPRFSAARAKMTGAMWLGQRQGRCVAEQVARAAPSEGAGGLDVSLWVRERG